MRLRHGLVACVLAGCGSISDNGNNIDAAVVADTTAPMVMSSGPSNMATNVSLLNPISVLFDEDLDEASVTSENVKVTYHQLTIPNAYFLGGFDDDFTGTFWPGSLAEPVLGDVSYDPMLKKVSFIPKAPLLPGQTYSIALTVKDTAGNAYDGMPIKFRTLVNAEAHRYYYTNLGAASYYYDYRPDETTGRMTGQATRGSAGPDGIWQNADDSLDQLYTLSYAPDGRINEERLMSPGDDGMYGTADDIPGASIFYKYNANNQLTDRALMYGPGPDNVYGTPDDSFYNVTTATYNGSQVVGYTTFNEAGSDTQWRTADDKCNFQQEPAYMGERKQRDVVKTCGVDKLPKTADDVINRYHEYTYDTNGQLTAIAFRTDIGPDNIWFTSDDRGGSQTKFDRDANGRITQTTLMVIGADNKWGTADDDIGSYDKVTYDDKGQAIQDVFYNGKGADNMWNTADDNVANFVVTSYDGRGARTVQKTMIVGPDKMVGTMDDIATQISTFDTAR